MKTTDSYAYESKLAGTDVTAKVIFAFVPLLLVFISGSLYVSAVVFLMMTIVNIRLGGVKPSVLFKYYTLPAAFLIFGTLPVAINGYNSPDGMLFSFYIFNKFYGISPDSALVAAKLASRALSALSCVYFLAFNTPMNMLFGFFERIKVPRILLALMELIYRNIFILLDESARIKTAQESRLGYSGLRVSFRSLGTLSARVFINSYMRSGRVYAALESRGWDGSFKQFQRVQTGGGKLYLTLCVLTAVISVTWFLDIL